MHCPLYSRCPLFGVSAKKVPLYIAFLMPHCPVTVVQRYRDGVCSLLFHLFFIICHPYIPLEMIFYTFYTKLGDMCSFNFAGAVVGLDKTLYSVGEDVELVEVCVVVHTPTISCPIQFPFNVSLNVFTGNAGILFPQHSYSY